MFKLILIIVRVLLGCFAFVSLEYVVWNEFILEYFTWKVLHFTLCVKRRNKASVMWEILAPVQTIKTHSQFWREHEASVLMVCASLWPPGSHWDSVAKSFSGTFCSNYFCSAAVKRQEQLGWKFDVLGESVLLYVYVWFSVLQSLPKTNEGQDEKITFMTFTGLTETLADRLAKDLLACVL